MLTVNEKLAREAVRRRLYLTRYSNETAANLAAQLARIPPKLLPDLLRLLDGVSASNFTAERINALTKAISKVVEPIYASIWKEATQELSTLSRVESNYHFTLMESVIPNQVLTAGLTVQTISFSQVWAAVNSNPFSGALLKDWGKGLAVDAIKTIMNTVTYGINSGQTTMQVIRAVTGTKALNYQDGALQAPSRHLANVVKTAISHVQAEAGDMFIQANNDIIKAQEWISTLDSHTSALCIQRDKLRYTIDKEPKPIGHSVPWGAGPGKLHFCCRSTKAPIVMSLNEIGLKGEFSDATRASMNGQVPAATKYADWIKSQPAWVQDDVLGVTRATLLRAGKRDVDSFFDKGERMTFAKLTEADKKAVAELSN